MDERFENLIRARDLKLAWIELGLFCVLLLAASRLSYWVVGFPSTNLMRHLGYVVIGMLIAAACLISVWTTLGEGFLARRCLFLACTATAILAAWMLGLTASFYPESVRLTSREEVHFLGLLPTVFLALCIPLIIVRSLFGFLLADRHKDIPPKAPITTAGLMLVTALVGCCLGGVRLTTAVIGGSNVLYPIAFLSGGSFLIGLLAVLPAVVLLCSIRRNFLVWSLVLNLIGSLLFTGAILGVALITGAWMSSQDALAIFECSLAATATFSVGIGIIRLFGYRLARRSLA